MQSYRDIHRCRRVKFMLPVSSPNYQIRDCESFADFAACIQMQREVWQFSDLDITPLRSFVITRNNGGFTLGAFAESDGRLLGFAHALAAFDETRTPFYYSQMLAVAPELHNSGIGMQLKFAQRQRALARGLPLMVWTFDPLQSRNAYLNPDERRRALANALATAGFNENAASEARRAADLFPEQVDLRTQAARFWMAAGKVDE